MISALMLYAHALTRNPAAAEDLLQDTLAEASIWPGEADRRRKTRLFSLMRTRFFNTAIRLALDPAPPTPGIDLSIAAPPDKVMRAVNRLPEHFREVVILVALLGQRYDDAAMVCDCPEDTFRRRVGRAREMVLANLGD